MSDHYILDGKTPVKAGLLQWARWFETANRHVAQSFVAEHRISTVFLGLDHQFGDGPPLLFETMVFKGDSMREEWCERCSTWDEAEAMHQRGCEHVRSKMN